MQIIRRYKNLNWFDLIDRIEYDMSQTPEKEIYLEIMDELLMRKHESISEGGTYKLKKPCFLLLEDFKSRMQQDQNFAESVDLHEITSIAKTIL